VNAWGTKKKNRHSVDRKNARVAGSSELAFSRRNRARRLAEIQCDDGPGLLREKEGRGGRGSPADIRLVGNDPQEKQPGAIQEESTSKTAKGKGGGGVRMFSSAAFLRWEKGGWGCTRGLVSGGGVCKQGVEVCWNRARAQGATKRVVGGGEVGGVGGFFGSEGGGGWVWGRWGGARNRGGGGGVFGGVWIGFFGDRFFPCGSHLRRTGP